MKHAVSRLPQSIVLSVFAFVALSMVAADAQGQLFRRYNQPAYSAYQPNYAVASPSSCTCQQQQAQMAQGYQYQAAQPQAVRYAVYYNPRTNQTYLRPINSVANSQTDVARAAQTSPTSSVVNQSLNSAPALSSPVVNRQMNQPALTQPVIVQPALSSPVPTEEAIEPATFTSQPAAKETVTKKVDVETNQAVPTPAPAPAKTEGEKESFSILESAGEQN